MSSPKFTAEFGVIHPLTPEQKATARANIAAVARDADDAELLCAALGLGES